MLSYECDPTVVFNDSKLPDGICDDLVDEIAPCASNIAIGWAVGGDYVSFQCSKKKVSHKQNQLFSNRFLSILKWLDTLLEVILRSNIICFKSILITHIKFQVKYLN